MAPQHKNLAPESDPVDARRTYEKPAITRVELTLEETLASGCKLGEDPGCVGPPVTFFDAGS